jgi:hypothetical protein
MTTNPTTEKPANDQDGPLDRLNGNTEITFAADPGDSLGLHHLAVSNLSKSSLVRPRQNPRALECVLCLEDPSNLLDMKRSVRSLARILCASLVSFEAQSRKTSSMPSSSVHD